MRLCVTTTVTVRGQAQARRTMTHLSFDLLQPEWCAQHSHIHCTRSLTRLSLL